MNFYVTQTISIQKLSIGTINNSSVVQIGTAGIINPVTHLYDTGNFTKAAPPLSNDQDLVSTPFTAGPSLVPLSPR